MGHLTSAQLERAAQRALSATTAAASARYAAAARLALLLLLRRLLLRLLLRLRLRLRLRRASPWMSDAFRCNVLTGRLGHAGSPPARGRFRSAIEIRCRTGGI